MNMFTSTSKNSDDGLKASYNISLLIAKAGNPHIIGEELILPAVKEVIKKSLAQISWTSNKIDSSQWQLSLTKSRQNDWKRRRDPQ